MARGKLWGTKLKEALAERLKTLDVNDVVTVSGIAGITFLIKPVIQVAPDVIDKAGHLTHLFSLTHLAEPFVAFWKGMFAGATRQGQAAMLQPAAEYIAETAAPFVENNVLSEPVAWILAFCVACIIWHFGPAILSEVGGVAKMAVLFLA